MQFLIPSSGPEAWRELLGDPVRHWKEGRSAWQVAHVWEEAAGLPPAVRDVLDGCRFSELQNLVPLIGIPELKVPLPGGTRPSQTDLWVLARNSSGALISITVEAKVDEPFGPTVADWGPDGSKGRAERFEYLCNLLGLKPRSAIQLRYQLLHRAASALLEAARYSATALMLVHSFDPGDSGFDDYKAFAHALGCAVRINEVGVADTGTSRLYLAWVR